MPTDGVDNTGGAGAANNQTDASDQSKKAEDFKKLLNSFIISQMITNQQLLSDILN
jgi:hypothetical protein